MIHRAALRLALPLAVLAAGEATSACTKPTPEPAPLVTGDAAAPIAATMPAEASAPPPALGDASAPPATRVGFGWDLDPKDPARDYVERYVQATERYGAGTPCAHAQASRVDGGRTIVEVRDASKEPGCKPGSALRDTFAVDVPADRLALAAPASGAPLAKWPDGSDPTGIGTASPREQEATTWEWEVRPALKKMLLVPIRLQWYARGSYPVVTIAGWRKPLTLDQTSAQLHDEAKELCAASHGRPFGIFGGTDRTNMLRIRCPDDPHWERVP